TLSANVKINIFRGSIDPANFVTQLTATTASGSKIWNVPAAQTLGTNYHVRVKEATLGTTSGDSPAFTVADCESGGSGPGLDPGTMEKIKDLMRRLERIPWWRNPKGPWPGPGPGPCLSCPVFDLQKLRDLLEEAGLKEEIGIALYNGGQKMADFGKFTPPSRFVGKGLKVKRLRGMKVMQSRVGMKSIKMEHTKMLSRGTGFKLIFMNSKGAIIGDFGVKLEEKVMK
ncbi:MAG: hypothetical protein KAR14_10325, partial [Candidatus Aminicenantes bacterium]|nr:hypothetical protein [Candidatus Aminicenantes bacterium]